MSDQEQKRETSSISAQPDAENKKKSTELSEEELQRVTGGDLDANAHRTAFEPN
jgi:bacteriocin-like protein